MTFTVPLAQAQQQFPEYRFIRALPPSAQKAAFHVQDREGQSLCLKVIAPNYGVDRVQREITAMLRVDHPNVVRFHEYIFFIGRNARRHSMVEHFIDGIDLSEALREGEPWPLGQVARFFTQLFEGLGVLHRHELVHRDLKPTNIRVDRNGNPVIIDLGQARLLDLPDITRTFEGAAIGTPAYFTPEQFEGTKYDIDARTDLFAAGVLIYTAVTGNHPFFTRGMDYDTLRTNVCKANGHLKSAAFTRLPKDWRRLLESLLHRSRSMRPSHAVEVAEMLRSLK